MELNGSRLQSEVSQKLEAAYWELSEAQDKGTEEIQTGDLDWVQYNRDVSLHQACSTGQLDVVKYILSQKISNIDCRAHGGRTPVMESAENGQVAVFDFLISHGSDLTNVTDNKNNVLHLACIGGNIDIVRTLAVNENYDIESKGDRGRTSVLVPAFSGNKDVFELLVSRGSNLRVVDDEKSTILHLACCGNVDIVKYLVSNKIVNIESRGIAGRTPVMYAVSWGEKGIFDFLVEGGCNLTVLDNNNDNVLHLACLGRDIDIVKYIVSHTIVDKYSRGFAGRTPVMAAVSLGEKEIFDFLVSSDCDLKVLENNKDNILHMACFGGNVDIVEYIGSNKIVNIESRRAAGRTPVMYAVSWGQKGIFDFLVDGGCNLTVLDNNNDNILHLACLGRNIDIVKYIVSHNIS